VAFLVVAAATVAFGLLSTRDLGLRYPPFAGNFAPRATLWIFVAVPCFAAAAGLIPQALRARPVAFASSLFVATLVLRLVLAAARGGTEQWAHVFRLTGFEGPNEYLPALPAFRYGTGFFLDRFAELVPSLPVHAAGHPPGLLLVMHALSLDTPARLAAFVLVVGSFAAPLTYVLAGGRSSEREARVAGGLMALAPGALLLGATSADAVYCTLGLLAAIPLARGKGLFGGAVLGAVMLFAWSLLALAAWAAILVLLRDGLKRAIRFGLAAGMGIIAVQAAFALATGFDPLGTLHATNRVYVLGIAARRPYAFWLFGSPVAFLLVLGLPIAWLAFRSASPEAIAIGAVLALSALAGFTKAETERIWLFYAPLVCLAAAPLVRRQRTLAAALALQALLYGALMDSVW
jgi:hypothetical protein